MYLCNWNRMSKPFYTIFCFSVDPSYILNSKRNANVCSDPVQSHYDKKFIHDNRSTSQNEIRAKCSLDICLSNCTVWYSLYTFLHTPPVSKTANVKT